MSAVERGFSACPTTLREMCSPCASNPPPERTSTFPYPRSPGLATYWLLHFGLCNDPRYGVVAGRLREYGFDKSHKHAQWTLAFFDDAGINTEIDLTPSSEYQRNGKDFTGLFLRRRANLLYLTYSQSYRGAGQHIDNLWHSVSLYRQRDKYAIRRMRWLRNNLEKFDLWDELGSRLNDRRSDAIPYINYPRALRPGKAQSALADAVIQELMANAEDWKFWNRNWAKVVLWDLRDRVSDRGALKAAAAKVFEGDFGHERYADILKALGESAPGDDRTRKALEQFESLFENTEDFRSLTKRKRRNLQKKADTLLAKQSPRSLTYFTDAVAKGEASIALWRFLLLNAIDGREDLLVRLTMRVPVSDYDLKHYFDSETPSLISSQDDAVYRALHRVFTAPTSEFDSDYSREEALELVAVLLSAAAHLPGVFEDLVGLVERAEPGERTTQLFSNVFGKTFDSPAEGVASGVVLSYGSQPHEDDPDHRRVRLPRFRQDHPPPSLAKGRADQ